MIKSELLKDKGVLIVSPVGPLAASDSSTWLKRSIPISSKTAGSTD